MANLLGSRRAFVGAFGGFSALALGACTDRDDPSSSLAPGDALLVAGPAVVCQSIGTADAPGDLRTPSIVAPPASGSALVHALGFYAAGDGGGGAFFWDAASTASDDGGIILLPAGHTGAGRWRRIHDSVINVRWFGARGDHTPTNSSDDSAAFLAALAYLRALDSYSHSQYESSVLFVPAAASMPYAGGTQMFGSYYLGTTTLVLDRRIVIRGVNPTASILEWASGTQAVHIAATPGSAAGNGGGSVLRDLKLVGGTTSFPGGASTAHGVVMNSSAQIIDCAILGFLGDGIHIESAPNYNCNAWKVTNTSIVSCGNNGIFTHGGNSNTGLASGVVIANCGLPLSIPLTPGEPRYGIYESGFLGNVYLMCEVEGTPGGIYAPTTVGSSTFLHCYAESGSPVEIHASNIAIGGNFGGGYSGNGFFVGAGYGALQIQPGIAVADTSDPNLTLSATLAPNDGTHTLLKFSSSNDGHAFQLAYLNSGVDPNWWAVIAANSSGYMPLNISDFTTRDPRDTTGQTLLGAGKIRFPYGFYMGLATGTRFFGQATAPPTGTATHYYRGDVLFNALPTPGGFAGWTCTASGAPGTWNGFGAISP